MKNHKIQSIRQRINGLLLHSRYLIIPDSKDNPPIVLVHGLSVSSRYMIPTIQALAPYYHVYAPDLPGFGKSEKPSHILSISELADWLAAYLEFLGIKNAVLLGNSLGCQIIVDFVLRYPSYATHIILTGPTTDPKGRTFIKEIKRILVDMTREPISYIPVIIKEYRDAGLRRTIATIQHGFHDKLEHKISNISIPTLIIRGNRDPIVPQYWVEQLHTLLPKSKLILIPNAAHAVNFNSPKKLAASVCAFLNNAA